MTNKIITSVLIGALLAAAVPAYAGESSIRVAMEDGKTRAQFILGDARCVLVDDEVRCTRLAK